MKCEVARTSSGERRGNDARDGIKFNDGAPLIQRGAMHGLHGRQELQFVEAVSKQWSARQENAAATVNTSFKSQSRC